MAYFVYVEPHQRSMAERLPGSLADTGDLALISQRAEADTANAVVTQVGVRRPHSLQRLYLRVENLAGACCFRIIDFFAMCFSS